MIPKVIHYTWFSGDPLPDEVLNCISSWKTIMPDYQLRLWDMDSIKDIDCEFLKEAISVKKWAYAADFIRLYALYNEGGLYLDTDVMIFKKYDVFLKDKCFIGKEEAIRFENFDGVQYLSSHCMGAEKGHPFIKHCMEYYLDRHFVISENEHIPTLLRYNYVLMPYIQAVIALDYGYNWKPQKEDIQKCDNGLMIYPSFYFCGNPNSNKTYCQHLALGSWREHFNYEGEHFTLFKKIRTKMSCLFYGNLNKFLIKHSKVLMFISK